MFKSHYYYINEYLLKFQGLCQSRREKQNSYLQHFTRKSNWIVNICFILWSKCICVTITLYVSCQLVDVWWHNNEYIKEKCREPTNESCWYLFYKNKGQKYFLWTERYFNIFIGRMLLMKVLMLYIHITMWKTYKRDNICLWYEYGIPRVMLRRKNRPLVWLLWNFLPKIY